MKLNLKIYIRYKNGIFNKNIKINKKNNNIKKTQSIIDIFNYFIIILSINYKNIIFYHLFINKTSFITMFEKKRKIFYLKLIIEDI